MAVMLSPKPSDGPLNGQSPSVSITVVSGSTGTVGGIIKIAGRPPIEVPVQSFLPGQTRFRFPLPPGGVPKGSELRLLVRESNGGTTFAVYKFE